MGLPFAICMMMMMMMSAFRMTVFGVKMFSNGIIKLNCLQWDYNLSCQVKSSACQNVRLTFDNPNISISVPCKPIDLLSYIVPFGWY